MANQINQHNTFDSFAPSYNNMIAYMASLKVAESPGKYNPLYIYGGTGLGKTHLLQAIAIDVSQKHSAKASMRVVYSTAEGFFNEWLDAVTKSSAWNGPKLFRDKYRSADVLIIDDVQFISGKYSIQEELLYTYDELYDAGKQIVFASDRAVAEIQELDERLRGRMMRGVTIEITAPDSEGQKEILRKKLGDIRTTIDGKSPEEVIQLRDSVWEIENMDKMFRILLSAPKWFKSIRKEENDEPSVDAGLSEGTDRIKHDLAPGQK